MAQVVEVRRGRKLEEIAPIGDGESGRER